MERAKAQSRPRGKKWPQSNKELHAWLQKKRREFKTDASSVPAQDSFEAFSDLLFLFRKHLKDLCTPWTPEEWESVRTIHNRRLARDPSRENGSPWLAERYYRFRELNAQEEEVEGRTREAWEQEYD